MRRTQGLSLFGIAGLATARAGKGFTLIEMMVVIAILGILLSIAAPSFTVFFEKYRAKRAAETINAFFVNAKSEAIKRNNGVNATFKVSAGGATWCIGLIEDDPTTANKEGCDCTSPGSCQLDGVDRVVSSADFKGVQLSNPANNTVFWFDQNRGTTSSGNAQITSAGGQIIRVVMSGRGRMKMCSPSGENYMGGYAEC